MIPEENKIPTMIIKHGKTYTKPKEVADIVMDSFIKKVKALKNKDNVFLLTDAGPARNQVLSEKFDIPLKKIIALRDPAQISKFGLDSVVPSAQGLRRQKKDPSYKLEKGSRDYRALKTPEKKKKVIDQFKKAGVNPTLYDDKLDIVAEAGRHGKLMRFASPLAAKGMVPNFVPPQRRLATTQRTALATKGAGSFDDFVSQKIIGKTYKEIERWGGGVSMGIMNRTGVGNMTEGAVKGLQQFNQKYLNLTNPLMGPLGPGKLPRVYDSPGFAIKHDKATFTKLEAERLQLQRSKITDAKKSREDNPNASPEELKELRRAIIKKKDVEIAAKNKEIGESKFGKAKSRAIEEERKAQQQGWDVKWTEAHWKQIPQKQRDEFRNLFNSTPEISAFFKKGGYGFAEGLVPNFSFYKNKGITDPTKVRHGIDPQGKGRGDFAGFQARTMARRGTLSKNSVFVNKGFGDKKTYYIKGQKVADAYKSSQAFQDGGFKLKAAEPPYLPKQLNYEWNQGTKMYRVEVPKGGQVQVAAEGLVPNFARLGGIHERAFRETNPYRRSTHPQNKSESRWDETQGKYVGFGGIRRSYSEKQRLKAESAAISRKVGSERQIRIEEGKLASYEVNPEVIARARWNETVKKRAVE